MYRNHYKILFAVYSIIYFISLLNDLNGRFVLDSISSIQQILGEVPLSNWHPFIYTFGFIYPLYILFGSDFSNVTLFQAILFYILNLWILICLLKTIKHSFFPKAQLLQLILFGIYLLHPLQFNFPFILWKDTPYTLIYTICIICFFFTRINPFVLLITFCYGQLIRHFGNFILLITTLIFFYRTEIQKVYSSKRLFYLIPLCFLSLSLFINYKLDRIDGIQNFIVESLAIVKCQNKKFPLFCSSEAILAKSCVSSSNVDTCIAESIEYRKFFDTICKPNLVKCKNEAYRIRFYNIFQYIYMRSVYIYKIIYRPLGDFSGEDGKLFLACFHSKSDKPLFNYFDNFSQRYSRFIYIWSLRMCWSQLLGLFSFMSICVLHFKYKKFLSTDLDNKLLLFLIVTGSGFASVLFGPFTANCFRYLWPYSQGALLVFLFVIPLFARIKENKSQENSLINVSSMKRKSENAD